MHSIKLLAFLLSLTCTYSWCRELTQLGLTEDTSDVICDITDPTECPLPQICVPTLDSAICAVPPISGAVISTNPRTFPVPTAYFPLTGQDLDSWPGRQYTGTVKGAVWRQDPEFGSVLHCKEGLNDLIELENVQIGPQGPFTVSFWMKKSLSSSFVGLAHQFMFSVSTKAAESNSVLDPAIRNQLHVFLPEERHTAHGLVRVIVKDNNDDESGVYYMDSDGRVNSAVFRNDTLPHVELADGQWHMITISSIPSRKGFRIFIDGELAARTPRDRGVTGGDPMRMDGNLHLCGRIDGQPNRHFDGSLAKLSIFNTTLTRSQIRALFLAVKQSTIERQIQSSMELQEWNQNTNATVYVDNELAVRYVRGPEVDVALLGRTDAIDASLAPLSFNLIEFSKRVSLCPTSPEEFGLDPDEFCTRREVCMPVHGDTLVLLHEMSELSTEEAFGLTGICARVPPGALLPSLDSGLPPPLAYFPLVQGQLDAWPVPNARGVAVATNLVDDEVFGEVFECSQSNRSFLILDNVPYGEQGHFTVNLWFQATDLTGDTFQYIFSHGPVIPSRDSWGPNQVQIYLSETNHTNSGIVRAIVKDTGDANGDVMFLDSDGDVALIRRKDQERTRSQLVNISDQDWHMLTISSRLDFKKGYSMFLDGRLVGEVREDVIYTGDDGLVRSATGGQSLRPGGKIYLCGRYDGTASRHFSGKIAEVMFFDQPLNERQINSLYAAALRSEPGLGGGRRKLMQDEEEEDNSALEGLPPGSWWGALNAESGSRFGNCADQDQALDGLDSQTQDCESGLSCVPILSPNGTELARTGVCVQFPPSGAYVFDSDSEIDLPVGYFPLTYGSFDSWPLPTFSGRSSNGVKFVEDEVFGSVLDCDESTQDHVILDNVPYVSNDGGFSLAIWIRQHAHHLNDSSDLGFEFIFSQISGPSESYRGLTDPNQIQVLVPRSDSGLPGRIRVIVRDEDDEDQDFVFLDSSENSPQVDINDGKWHMLAVTSQPDQQKGFRVFIDGVLVNEVNGSDVTGGGDQILLTSPIHLCGRADDNNGTYFDGNLAHLILWDVPLTETQLFAIYERFILAAESVQIEHPQRQTINGDRCVFPAILRGEIVIDCTPLDDVFKCPIKNGTWVECDSFNESYTYPSESSTVRTTIDGERCRMPGELNGREIFGCVDISGIFSCEVRPGQWKECSPLIELRYTTNGIPCVFPFIYEGIQYSNCVPISVNEEICQTSTGEFQTCARPVFEEDLLQLSSSLPVPESSPGTVLVDEVLIRTAENGDICSFPFWFDGLSVGGCVELEGNQMCQTRNGTMEICSSISYTIDGTPCALPFPSNSAMNSKCISRGDDLVCRVANGSFAPCETDNVVSVDVMTGPVPILAGRVTMSNKSCSFPFWYEGKLVSDCVGNRMERCMTKEGQLEECQPKQMTLDGDQCSFPFQFEESIAFNCVSIGGFEQCKTANGSLAICASTPAPKRPLIERFSIQGLPCEFPFTYNEREWQDCVTIDNEESCKVKGGQWAICASVLEVKVFQRRTTSGQDCVIPFLYNDRLHTDCFRGDNREELCRTEDDDGPLEECAPREDNTRAVNELIQYPYERNTTDGMHCVFPFHYRDELWVNCVEIDETEWCKILDGTWQECIPNQEEELSPERPLNFTRRFAMDGDECAFPFNYNGEELYECVEIDGTEYCKDEANNWEECAPLEIIEQPRNFTRRFTTDGDECAFPLAYNGEELYECVEIEGIEQCKDEAGNWEECSPSESTERPRNFTRRFTTDGGQCVFPLNYNGDELYTCIEIEGAQQCKDENGLWKECIPRGANRPIVALSDEAPEDEKDDSTISTGAVIGIGIAVLIGIIVALAIAAIIFLKYRRHHDKNVETSRSHFERYKGDEGEIAMSDISAKQRMQTAPASDEVPL